MRLTPHFPVLTLALRAAFPATPLDHSTAERNI